MQIKILILSTLFLSLSFSALAYQAGKPQVRWKQLYRYDTRHEKHQLYVNRISGLFTYQDRQKKQLFKITPFFEARRNINKDVWEREELGLEVGRDICPWFYLGEAIQAVWLREDYRRSDHQNYNWHKERDSTESETRIVFRHKVFSIGGIELGGFLLGEYTYDFELGAGVRDEAALGFNLPLNKHIETEVSLRHIDRIHDFDSDVVEASLTVIF